jgi:hypothetical protein
MFLTSKKLKKLYLDKKDNLFFLCVSLWIIQKKKKLVYERVL